MKRVPGTVRDGVVVLDESLEVPDGTRVLVEVPARDWVLRFAGAWQDDPGIEAWLSERRQSRTMSEGPALSRNEVRKYRHS
jgi:hypothetical protein